MSWLGKNGASREDFMSLADAYASMYQAAEEADEEQQQLEENRFAAHGGKSTDPGANLAMPGKGMKGGKTYTMKGKDGKPLFPRVEEADLLASLADAYGMMYEKKKDSDKCGEGTYWDSEDKKCKKKKSSSKTVVVGRGGYWGGGHHHGGSNGGGDGEGETDGGDGGETGGGDGGGGGGE